jgi:uncharacterized phage protein (TIGR02220 family)
VSWVRVDDAAPNHPKLFRVGLEAMGFWLCCLCYANRTLSDGHIPSGDLGLVAPGAGRARAEKLAKCLAEGGLLRETPDGFWIHDFLDYQPSAAQIRAERLAARGRMARLRSQGVRQNVDGRAPDVRANSERTSPEVHVPHSHSHSQTSEAPLPPGGSHDPAALEWLQLLNAETGRAFKLVAGNLKPIRARLREGYTLEQARAVVRSKVTEWARDPRMVGYLRPSTIFGPKFDSYVQALDGAAAANGHRSEWGAGVPEGVVEL